MKKRIFIQGFLMSASLIMVFFLSKYLFVNWKSVFLDRLFDFLGLVVVLMGFLFRISARGYKAECSKDGGNLIFGGPYKLIRNPMYFGTLLIGMGVISMLFQWWVAVFFLVVYLSIYLPQIKREEKFLLDRFGQDYRLYCRQTHRFFPGITSLFKNKLRECLLFRWSWIKKEAFSLIIVLFVVYVLESWKEFCFLSYSYKKFSGETVNFLLMVTGVSTVLILIFHAEKFPKKLQNNFKLQAKR